VVGIYGVEVDISDYWTVLRWPITVAVRSKAALSNTGVMGLNPTRGKDVCVRFYVFVLFFV
jgi:hypothetical protein